MPNDTRAFYNAFLDDVATSASKSKVMKPASVNPPGEFWKVQVEDAPVVHRPQSSTWNISINNHNEHRIRVEGKWLKNENASLITLYDWRNQVAVKFIPRFGSIIRGDAYETPLDETGNPKVVPKDIAILLAEVRDFIETNGMLNRKSRYLTLLKPRLDCLVALSK